MSNDKWKMIFDQGPKTKDHDPIRLGISLLLDILNRGNSGGAVDRYGAERGAFCAVPDLFAGFGCGVVHPFGGGVYRRRANSGLRRRRDGFVSVRHHAG